MGLIGWLQALEALSGLAAIAYATSQLITGRQAAPGQEMNWKRPRDAALFFFYLGLWLLLQGAAGFAGLEPRLRTILRLLALVSAGVAFLCYRPRRIRSNSTP